MGGELKEFHMTVAEEHILMALVIPLVPDAFEIIVVSVSSPRLVALDDFDGGAS
ncbi:MAG: hypothetical protein M2R45_02753 [Verrucomicrobia subdivision 3 bacterium]|nr:hypothetical protein [Limisphaerales bacterium]MCS1414302.1 hypothetical protein [Limisphaerales bacterium]